ncbi:MAG: pantoate--beta-alanine ligase [Proteobacteria bacterium]|nr:MAG: pantoate--beta-alanine ligase [Pseudomonadota bacterium]
MQLVHSIAQLRSVIKSYRRAGETIGLVPTMGNLHAGHLELVKCADGKATRKVVSIFVNPTQFEKQDDLDKYPRTMEADLAQLEALGVDVVFAPEPQEMYPHGRLVTHVDVPKISSLLEGSSRPGHFRGVATVVTKLFNIVTPDYAVFGQKDFQQLMLVRQVVKDLDIPIEIIAVPTMREKDGLAMSSRNNRLTQAQRRQAPNLYRVLQHIEIQLSEGVKDFQSLQNAAMAELDGLGFQSDYIQICNANDLMPAAANDKALVILAAAYMGDIRLIDNIPVQLA